MARNVASARTAILIFMFQKIGCLSMAIIMQLPRAGLLEEMDNNSRADKIIYHNLGNPASKLRVFP
jgi:hypothetical protein